MKGRTWGQIVWEQMFTVTALYLEMPSAGAAAEVYWRKTLIRVLLENAFYDPPSDQIEPLPTALALFVARLAHDSANHLHDSGLRDWNLAETTWKERCHNESFCCYFESRLWS